MYRKTILLAIVACISLAGQAKEGMWIPSLLKKLNEPEMKDLGFKLTAEDIYSINKGSIKDAIVHFGGGCTAEVISKQGLILTNHHCGYGQIQQHSSLEHDYLKNGFWAKSFEEELKNQGLTATFIRRIEDVTADVNAGLTKEMLTEERNAQIKKNVAGLKEKFEENGKYQAVVKPYYYGNEYYLILTQTFTDVRLVGAPPSSVGKFGGDTDNWMWPRHTGDFSIFRIYADQENKPAAIAENNKPYTPEYALPINMNGVKEGDFTMVYGFPGSTEQYLTSDAVDFVQNNLNPMRIDMRATSLNVIDAAMRSDDKTRIQYAAKQSRISNAYKKWIGQNRGLKKLKAVKKKQETEKEFEELVHNNKEWNDQYGGLLAKLKNNQDAFEQSFFDRWLFIEYVYYGPELFRFANSFEKLVKLYEEKGNSQELRNAGLKQTAVLEGFYKDFNSDVDQGIFKALTEKYLDYNSGNLPKKFSLIDRWFKGDVEAFSNKIYEWTVFNDQEKLMSMMKNLNSSNIKRIKRDPMFIIMRDLFADYSNRISSSYASLKVERDALYKEYMAGLMTVFPEERFWPDANSTLRLTYGKAEGSVPRDGVNFRYYTTAQGILDKYKPNDYDFDLPEELIALIESEDFGPYADADESLHVCFTASNHTSGGNSGSPVINGNGELVGLNFDRTWESTMSDIMFDPNRCRNIAVDIRYVLFIIDKFAGADRLIEEMNLVSSGKSIKTKGNVAGKGTSTGKGV